MRSEESSEPDKEIFLSDRDLLQRGIDTEYALIDGRLNMLLIFHGILFGVFGVVVSSESTSNEILPYIKFGAPIIGIITAGVTHKAIFAGRDVIVRMKRQRANLAKKYSHLWSIEEIGVQADTSEHRYGILPPLLFPGLLWSSWILILLYELFKLIRTILINFAVD